MTSDAKTAGAAAGSDAPGDMTAVHHEAAGTMIGIGIAWAEAMSLMGAEVAGFLSDRVRENLNTRQRLLQCKDMEEIQHVQARFVQTAIEDYQAEFGKLIDMGAHALEGMAEGARGS